MLSVGELRNYGFMVEIGSVSGTVLGTFDIFRALSIDQREQIANELLMYRVGKGQFVISDKSSSTDVYFLVSGRIRVCSIAQTGKQIHFEELLPGMMFGELSAIDGLERSSDCLSMEDCTLAIMTSDHFKRVINRHPEVQQSVLLRLAAMVRGNMRKVFEFSALTVGQRIHCELLRLASDARADSPEILLATVPTHAEIASRVSTHREAVTRELKLLETDGLITWKKNHHVIHDVVKLSEMAFNRQ